jgi:O-antigen ligase
VRAGAFAIGAARMLSLAALVFAPWAFGTTRDWTIHILVTALLTAAALWVFGRAAQRRLRETLARIPLPLVLIIAGLLVLGWSITLNPRSYYDPLLGQFFPSDRPVQMWPGTVDGSVSRDAMLRVTALLLTVALMVELFRRRRWRRVLLAVLGLVGISIALFGLAQKIFHAPLAFWELDRFSDNTFGMYRYHGNAGAYLNLTWPICALFAVEAFRDKHAFLQRAVWLPATLVGLVGVFVNISKAAQLIAVVLLIVLASLCARREERARAPLLARRGFFALLVIAGALVLILAMVGPEPGVHRWRHLLERGYLQEGRWWAAHACLDIVRASPWFGNGAGTFSVVFPFYLDPYPVLREGYWRYAHCDYLQTLVEWGATGGVLWAAFWGGGLITAASRLRRCPGAAFATDKAGKVIDGAVDPPRIQGDAKDPMDIAVFVSLIGVTLHAAVDFPLQIASIQLYAAALLAVAWRTRG